MMNESAHILDVPAELFVVWGCCRPWRPRLRRAAHRDGRAERRRDNCLKGLHLAGDLAGTPSTSVRTNRHRHAAMTIPTLRQPWPRDDVA